MIMVTPKVALMLIARALPGNRNPAQSLYSRRAAPLSVDSSFGQRFTADTAEQSVLAL